MNINTRRIYLVIIFIIFLIIAPIILLYAIGYRYDLKRNKVVRVGVLYIKSTPESAYIYLNGNNINRETTAQITNLLPNEYQLELRKDGYYNWQKKITIYPEVATILKNVTLFKSDLSVEKLIQDIKQVKISPKNDKVIYLINDSGADQLWTFDLNTKENKLIYVENSSNTINDFFWSPSADNILVNFTTKNVNNYLIINLLNEKKVDLYQLYKFNFENVIWDSDNENLIYGKFNNNIYQINLLDSKTELILNVNAINYLVKNNTIFYIANDKNIFKLKYMNLIKKETNDLFNLDSSNYFLILNEKTQFIIVIDQNNQNVYLIDSSSNIYSYEKLNIKAKFVQFTDDMKKLLYYNDFEIGFYDFEKGENQIITRTSNQINEAVWHPLEQDIIYLEENKLKVVEIEGPIRNMYDLLESKISNLIVDKNGRYVYFLAEDGNNKIFSRINIQ